MNLVDDRISTFVVLLYTVILTFVTFTLNCPVPIPNQTFHVAETLFKGRSTNKLQTHGLDFQFSDFIEIEREKKFRT